ncbi:MAG: FG-GAP repeat protein [Dokdonella sp.]|uniref:FG-GAP repeat protein n=2 Tax=Dokdonella sp. TaxID=2291710 RepID=UPI003BAE34E4
MFPFPLIRTLIGILLACMALPAAATDYAIVQQLSAVASGQGEAHGFFGWSVAVDGDLAVAAELRQSAGLPARIRTYARSGSSWLYQSGKDIEIPGDSAAKLTLNDGTLALTAFSSTTSRGYVQILRWSGSNWIQEASISSTTAFFDAVATNSQFAVAGEWSYDGAAGTNQGRIRILRRQANGSWNSQTLTPTTPQAGALFGWSVAIVSGAIVVGAPYETVTDGAGTHTRAGAAYVYELTIDTWNQVARLVEAPSGSHAQNQFGYVVAISGADPGTPDRLLVGRASNASNGRIGIVRGYRRVAGTWTPGLTISASVPSTADQFGCSLAMDGDWAVIGVCASASAGINAGAVIAAHFNSTFTSVSGMVQHTDPQGSADEFLGSSVAIDRDGPTLMVGNISADLYGNADQGVVLISRSPINVAPSLVRAIDLGQGLTDARASEVAADGDTMIIGARGENVGIQHARGAAYVYRRQTSGLYELESRLLAPDGTAFDMFGTRVALKGDVALVSATGYSTQGQEAAGAVYAFHREGSVWTLEAQFLPPAPVENGSFGLGLAFDGGSALIGEFDANTAVIERSAGGVWTPMQDLPHRGWNVQVDGTTAMLGDSLANGNIGEVAIYSRVGGTWQPAGTLSGFNANQGFGTDVALDGDHAAVASGAATAPMQVYRRNGTTWLPEASLLPNDATADTQCYRAALRGPTLAMGCWNPSGSREGAAYVFERNGTSWSQAQKLTLSGAKPFDQFGVDVSFGDNDSLLVGAYRRDIDFMDQGAVYVFRDDVLFEDGFD